MRKLYIQGSTPEGTQKVRSHIRRAGIPTRDADDHCFYVEVDEEDQENNVRDSVQEICTALKVRAAIVYERRRS